MVGSTIGNFSDYRGGGSNMSFHKNVRVWIAENRGKNHNGYELVIYKTKSVMDKKTKKVTHAVGETWVKKISKKDVKLLKELKIEIEEG